MKATEPVASIKYRLTQVPPGADVALLVRHAEREEIPIGTFGEDVQLTSRGIVEAERLGRVLASRRWEGIVSSPLLRCCETAVKICRGAGTLQSTSDLATRESSWWIPKPRGPCSSRMESKRSCGISCTGACHRPGCGPPRKASSSSWNWRPAGWQAAEGS